MLQENHVSWNRMIIFFLKHLILPKLSWSKVFKVLTMHLPISIKGEARGFIVIVRQVGVRFKQAVVWSEVLFAGVPRGCSEPAIGVVEIKHYSPILRGLHVPLAVRAKLTVGANGRLELVRSQKNLRDELGFRLTDNPLLFQGCWMRLSLQPVPTPLWIP